MLKPLDIADNNFSKLLTLKFIFCITEGSDVGDGGGDSGGGAYILKKLLLALFCQTHFYFSLLSV